MAVYTAVDDSELRNVLTDYDIGALVSLKGIAEGVENSNYLVVTTSGNYILTLYEKRVDRTDLPFFLGLMTHLAKHGLNCPQPIPDRSGEPLREIAGRSGAIFSFLAGTCARVPTPAQCHAAGQALARLHLFADDFAMTRRNALGPAGWRRLHRELGNAKLATLADYSPVIDEELAYLCGAWPDHLPVGTIHADFFPNNVFFLDGELSGIIDFYFACTDVLLYDVAITANAWCFDPTTDHDLNAQSGFSSGAVSLNIEKLQALISGYAQLRPGVNAELAHLCNLSRAAALRFFLTRAVDWLHTPPSALVERLDPADYFSRLQVWRAVARFSPADQRALFSAHTP